jgi:hypothetical protein
MRAAREALARRFHGGVRAQCLAILDMLVFSCESDPANALRGLRSFRVRRSNFPRHTAAESFRAYSRVQWFEHRSSRMKILVESDRSGGWLAPFRVTLYADDITGLVADEVLAILEVLPRTRLALVEVALDFSPLSNVDRAFVRRHGVFGKTHRDTPTTNEAVDWWGTRNGAKRVKSYRKDVVGAHRVEFRVRLRFLKKSRIQNVYDLHRLASLLPHQHILFARLDEQRLIARLGHNGFSNERTLQILREVARRGADLDAQLIFLRRDIKLANTRRLLNPLPENQLVRDALREWAERWPLAPLGLQKKKSSRIRHRGAS